MGERESGGREGRRSINGKEEKRVLAREGGAGGPLGRILGRREREG